MYTFQMITDRLNSSLILKGEVLPHDMIETVRIASEEPMQEHILYLSPDRKKNTTCCRTVTGSMLLYDADMSTVLNRILEIFEYYHTWEDEIQKASRRGCTLSELLDLAYPLISHPILILDNNEWMIACTSVLEQVDISENEDLSDLVRFRSSSTQKIAEFNQTYPEVFTRRDVYPVPGNIFSTNAGYSMNLFHGNQLSGFMLIDSLDVPITQGKLDIFYLLGIRIQEMLNDPSSGLSIGTEETSFLRFLENPSAENKEELRHDLQVKTWNDTDEKQLIFIRPSSGRSLSPNLNHALIMFNRLFGLQAAEYRNGILLFLNRKILDERFGYEPVIQRILQLSYCAGISNSFQDLSDLPLMAQRALAALKAGDQSAGSINYFRDYYMNYFFSLISDSDKEILRHPLLDQLKRYDKRYGSSLYETLFRYLENERRIARTAAVMNLHRSTLLHRIERIEELAQGLLEHPETRMHILLSFYLENAEAGE